MSLHHYHSHDLRLSSSVCPLAPQALTQERNFPHRITIKHKAEHHASIDQVDSDQGDHDGWTENLLELDAKDDLRLVIDETTIEAKILTAILRGDKAGLPSCSYANRSDLPNCHWTRRALN